MFCPQCGSESNEGQHYCRSCGTNLKVIGKVVSFSDVISKTDTVSPKMKEKVGRVAQEVSRAMSKVNEEMTRDASRRRPRGFSRRTKTPEERRERHLTKGTVKFFFGGGLSIFLYAFFHAVQLQLPPDVVANTPFAIDPVVRVLWTIGLIPMLSGVGHILAGLTVKRGSDKTMAPAEDAPLNIEPAGAESFASVVEPRTKLMADPPDTVTDRTTNILDRDRSWEKSKVN